ncbi:ATP-binding protein [Methylophaga sp.]|uniref:ATP-binding protein n=1 Tax=Methylophaga sp. TaxID=2024840 RepID=UPI0013FFCFFC|nr:ATP-binding protein [Methylophaga sp.]MTI64423.1 PAS domain-containing sensor histidine kinase [Methylophaga sp.]
MVADLTRLYPRLIAFATFIVAVLTGLYLMIGRADEARFSKQEQLHQTAYLFATAFEREVHVMRSIPQILHAQFQLLGPEKFTTAFPSLALDVQHSFQRTGVIIALAPAGEVSHAYPGAGEPLLGVDLMQGLERDSILRAMSDGPVVSKSWSLIPGEQMLLIHYPVFHPGEHTFWGLITAMAPMNAILRQSNLMQLSQYSIALNRTLTNGSEQTFFSTTMPADEALSLNHYMDLPDGDWQLQISTAPVDYIKPVWLSWIVFSAGLLALTAYRLSIQPQKLRAEVAARTSELASHDKFLNELISSLPVGIVVTDTFDAIRYSNPVFNRLMSRSVEEGESLVSLLEDVVDNANMRQFLVSRISLDEVNFDVMVQVGEQEFSLTCSHIDTVQGNLLVWVFRDITEISRINRTLRSVSATRAEMLRLIPDPMAFFNKKGELMESNPGFQALFAGLVDVEAGFSCESFEKQLLANSAEPDRLKPVFDLTQPQQGQLHVDAFILTAHPQRVFERTVCFDNSSNTVGSIMYFRDVTDAHEVDRMKTEFLSTAAHELRTPLANIFGYTELLIKAHFDARRQEEMLGVIYSQTRRLSNIIDDLLDLARIESRAGGAFKFDHYDLSQLIDNVLKEMELELRSRHLDYVITNDNFSLYCDADKIEQVVENLLSNAIKYSPQATPISLFVGVEAREDEPGFILRLEDQGMGMSEEDLEHVFDRFYRADTSGQIPGTGLGMAIVREIIQHHDGQISIDSEPDAGTTVTVWLPRRQLEKNKQLEISYQTN